MVVMTADVNDGAVSVCYLASNLATSWTEKVVDFLEGPLGYQGVTLESANVSEDTSLLRNLQ